MLPEDKVAGTVSALAGFATSHIPLDEPKKNYRNALEEPATTQLCSKFNSRITANGYELVPGFQILCCFISCCFLSVSPPYVLIASLKAVLKPYIIHN